MMMIMTGVPKTANCSPLLSPPESLLVIDCDHHNDDILMNNDDDDKDWGPDPANCLLLSLPS